MISFTGRFKIISPVLILFLLACSAPARRSTSEVHYEIAAQKARNIDWSQKEINIYDSKGHQHAGILRGWNEIGLILEDNGKSDTLAYENIEGYLAVKTDKTNSDVGIKNGIIAGIALASFNLLANLDIFGPDETISDNEMGNINYLLITTPMIIIGGALVGGLIGSTNYKYDKYYFNKNDFKANPWQYNSSDDKNNYFNKRP